MATCKTCNYPYVGKGSCPNCGEKFPIKTTLFGLLFIGAIIWGAIYFLGGSNNYNDYNEQESITTTINDSLSDQHDIDTTTVEEYVTQEPEPAIISTTSENQQISSTDEVLYVCRECENETDWKSSFYWLSLYDAESDQLIESVVENQRMIEGHETINNELSHVGNIYQRGVFCSRVCAQNNLNRWENPSQ